MKSGVGDKFQAETKYNRKKMPEGFLDIKGKPSVYKDYPKSKKIALQDPDQMGNTSLIDVLRQRKSVRQFLEEPLTIRHISNLTWATNGIQRKEMGCEFRTAPSAGALYPIEIYIIANNVEDLSNGIYHYNIRQHCLEDLRHGDFREQIASATMGQRMCAQAAAVFIFTAIFKRTTWKYQQRAYRYIYLDAGHAGQNLALSAVSMGLGSCQVGALFDDEINQLVGIDGIYESVLYISAVGHPGIYVS